MIPAVMPTYGRADIAFERGEGVYLYAADGRRFLDFGAGVAVTALGHCHPHLMQALSEQAGKVWHCSNLYRVPGQEKLAARLVERSFADSVFFCNSGAEAMECSIKVARKYQSVKGHPERFRILACEGAFHGRTLATIAAGGQAKMLDGFGPMVDGFDHVPFGNLNAMRAAVGESTAAILVEPVQGEGGIRPATAEYLRGLRKIADEFGVLLLFDEVQTGMGRTGKLFAHEWSGVVPDVMGVAKGLGGGFPIGACLANERAASAMSPGSHGSTFGGNPLATAVANGVLDVILGEGFLDRVNAVAAVLWARLREIQAARSDLIADVRGQGLMIGLQCRKPLENKTMVKALFDGGLLSVPADDNIVRLIPPLIIDENHIAEACAVIEETCAKLQQEKP